jgi:predicted phosphodiesterase
MSTLIISDIHADIRAFDCILSIISDARFVRKYSKVEKIFNLGDTIDRGYHPREVIDKIRELKKSIPIVSLVGNHDEAFLYGHTVSGSDAKSRGAHKDLGEYALFLKDLPQFYIDNKDRILAVHGGPIDPNELNDSWLYHRSWQRISSKSYISSTGYHYTPREAFDYVKRVYGDGYVILCGHEHKEAAYSDSTGDILKTMSIERRKYMGFELESKWVARNNKMSYLIRVGISGPEGYRTSLGLDASYFGLIWKADKMERMGLFNFKLKNKQQRISY